MNWWEEKSKYRKVGNFLKSTYQEHMYDTILQIFAFYNIECFNDVLYGFNYNYHG